MPEEVHEKLSDAQIYSGLWDSMMKLEDLLYNAFFYCGDFKGSKPAFLARHGVFTVLQPDVHPAAGAGVCTDAVR